MLTRSQIASAFALSCLAVFAGCSSSNDSATGSSSSDVSADTLLGRPAWATPERLMGQVDDSKNLSIQVHMHLRGNGAAEAELAEISNPDSPRFGQYLTKEQFENKYAPTEFDVIAVRNHLEKHGLKISEVPDNRMYVKATGTAKQLKNAFGAQLGVYNVAGSMRHAPMAAPHIPASLSSRVSSVLGLSQSVSFKPKGVRVGGIKASSLKNPHRSAADGAPAPACSEWYGQNTDTTDPAFGGGFPTTISYAPCGYKPAQLRAAYGLNDAIRKGNDGTGQTVAIIDAFESPTLLKDAQTYAAQNDPDYPLKASQFSIVKMPPTDPPTDPDTGWYGEQTLDVEALHAMAPGAKIVYVGAANADDQDLVAALNKIISGKLATIVSNSYGSAEGQANDFVIWQSIVTQAGLKGIGVYFASGDNGDEAQNLGFASPDFPASLPGVTAVGGTTLALDQTGQRTFEVGWETGASFLGPVDPDTAADAGAGADAGPPALAWSPAPPGEWVFGAGGGTSYVYPQPAYQKGIVPNDMANVPGAPARVVPDVGMLADPMTGFLIGQSDPTSGVYAESGIGGTSLACPLFAGVMAITQQHAKRQLGFVNPVLYKNHKKAFRDIAPSTPQAVAIPGGIITTFDFPGLAITTAVGYDNVTGLGAPNGTAFLNAIK